MLIAKSVDVSHTHRVNGRTATNRIVNDDSGERYGVEGAWKGGVYEQFELVPSDWEFLEDFDVWSTHANCPSYAEALERKRDHQWMTVDFLHLENYELLQKSLDVVDIAFFGGTADMVDDLTRIAHASPRGIIVLTLGSDGSIAFEQTKSYTQNALPLEKVVDTTGCGDAFQAGFTASYFRTKDIRASLLAGAKLAQAAALHFGGTPWPL